MLVWHGGLGDLHIYVKILRRTSSDGKRSHCLWPGELKYTTLDSTDNILVYLFQQNIKIHV